VPVLLLLLQVLRQAGRPSEAQSLSEEALSLLQNQLGSEHPRVAAQLMILGQLAAQQNKQAVAEQTFRKALQVSAAAGASLVLIRCGCPDKPLQRPSGLDVCTPSASFIQSQSVHMLVCGLRVAAA
jgi:uncharacterized protein HemY